MKHTRLFYRVLTLSALAAGLLPAALSSRAQAVEALVYSTMPATAAHRPEMALDGDLHTYFKSAYGMDDGDDFLVLLSQPIPVQSLRITTGDADGENLLTGGFVETSPDAVHYSTAAVFGKDGVATAALGGKPVRAFRIRLSRGNGLPTLLVREITLNSPVKITSVAAGPGRGFADISQAPDVVVWARQAETQMEEFWPDTAALLYSDRFIPPNMVNVVYRHRPRRAGRRRHRRGRDDSERGLVPASSRRHRPDGA